MKITQINKNSKITFNNDPLQNLLISVKENYVVRVGILGSKGTQTHQRKETGELKKGGGHKTGAGASDQSNADIGLEHEKGVKSKNLPRRSWLVNPLEDHISEYFEKLGAEVIKDMLVKQPEPAYNALGVNALQIIQKGFETGGYGKWKPLKAMTIANKKSSQILIDTGQLRKSITFQVVKK